MKTYLDWLKEHYPTPANDPEALAKPITHSLRTPGGYEVISYRDKWLDAWQTKLEGEQR